MTSLTQNRITAAVALLLPGAATLWLLMRSSMAGTGTYAVFAALVIAIALIALNTWKNSQPTGSVGQLIHDVDETSSPTTGAAVAPTSADRWNAWRSRGEVSARTGRVRAWLAVSVVVTAVLLYLWRA
jgi:hypothetical protein